MTHKSQRTNYYMARGQVAVGPLPVMLLHNTRAADLAAGQCSLSVQTRRRGRNLRLSSRWEPLRCRTVFLQEATMDANSGESWSEADISDFKNELDHSVAAIYLRRPRRRSARIGAVRRQLVDVRMPSSCVRSAACPSRAACSRQLSSAHALSSRRFSSAHALS